MSFFSAVSDLLIRPLELFFEIIFTLAYRVIGNPGLSIIFLSLAMNFLVLPLYKKADAMQEEARETEDQLSTWVNHIKKTFKGDERYMILQTYYRQNHYKPTDALKGSVSLLLEVPFFMAAYKFLSQLQLIRGVSFGPIADLGAPDGLLVIAGVAINVLPILMTAINLVSGYIYTKGFPAKAKVQLYGMALIFLVLLYQSPAGLVFYWTLNNIFSLFKNVFYKLKNPRAVFGVLSALLGAGLLLFILLHPMPTFKRQLAVILLALGMLLPLLINLVQKYRKNKITPVEVTTAEKNTFFLGCVFIALMTGLLIPSTLVANSPTEFVNAVTLVNPIWYVVNALLIATGTFVIWFGIFYMLAGPTGKRIMSAGMWTLSGIAFADYMFFGKGYGNLASNLKFDRLPTPAAAEQLQNLLILVVLAAVLLLLWKKRESLVRFVYLTAALALVVMSVINFPTIYSAGSHRIAEYRETAESAPSIPLSKEGKNVMILMLDRAVGLTVPYLFEEKPELKEQFSGFTYYPCTLSYGMNTNIGSPGLYGGYEYSPEKINLRTEETLEQKHDEALRVMPDIFYNHGYEVTVTDAPLAGYSVIPGLSIYDDYPGMHAYRLMERYANASGAGSEMAENLVRRNLFCYSLFKISPVFAQPLIYAQGSYNDADELYASQLQGADAAMDEQGQIMSGPSVSSGLNPSFMHSYRALDDLPNLTEIRDGRQNTFLMLANNITHSPMLLQEPDYTPAGLVDNTAYDAAHTDRFNYRGHEMLVDQDFQMSNYHCNMAGFMELGQWFDYLKANGVYDNTRIIIVSDHGYNVYHFPELMFSDEWPSDILAFNSLLMVKDFGSDKPFAMDTQFMMNADVPTIATDGIIENPTNPFSGAPINSDAKNAPFQLIFNSAEWEIEKNNTATYLPDSWYAVTPDFLNPDSWTWLNGPAVLPEY